jgi:hypothetical protein
MSAETDLPPAGLAGAKPPPRLIDWRPALLGGLIVLTLGALTADLTRARVTVHPIVTHPIVSGTTGSTGQSATPASVPVVKYASGSDLCPLLGAATGSVQVGRGTSVTGCDMGQLANNNYSATLYLKPGWTSWRVSIAADRTLANSVDCTFSPDVGQSQDVTAGAGQVVHATIDMSQARSSVAVNCASPSPRQVVLGGYISGGSGQ